MRIITEEKLREIKESMPDGTSKLFMHTLIGMCKEIDTLSVTRPIGKSGRPTKYPFRDMQIGDIDVILFDDKKDVRRAKCAANTLSYLHGLKFDVKSRENDAGKFELTVKRVG